MSAQFDVGEVDRHDERLPHALPVRLARVDPAFRWKDATQSLPTAVGMSTCPVYPEILSRVEGCPRQACPSQKKKVSNALSSCLLFAA